MAELTAQEQLILELINRARMDPAGEAKLYGIDLNAGLSGGTISATPKQVLAFNFLLNDSADAHSTWMLDTDTFSHTGAKGTSPDDRMTSAGYVFSGSWTWGENIAWTGTTGTLDADAAAAQHHQNLFLSAGHRVNILKDSFREVGIGSVVGKMTSNATYNALMTTQNFASSGSSFFITGVVYNDINGDDFYSIGEGQGGRSVTLLQNGVEIGLSTSATAGGYALGTTVTGTVEVWFSGTAIPSPIGVTVTLSGSNVKVDLVDGNTIFSNVSATLTQQTVGLQLIGIEDISGTGNSLSNFISGNSGMNKLSSGGGNDTLSGGAGKDVLVGGSGSDKLIGGDGIDKLTGGAGADHFIFNTVAELNGDLIRDFVTSQDKIDLSAIDSVMGGSNDAFTFKGTGGFDGVGDLTYRHTASQTIIEGDINGDGNADFILKLTGIHTLTIEDFIL